MIVGLLYVMSNIQTKVLQLHDYSNLYAECCRAFIKWELPIVLCCDDGILYVFCFQKENLYQPYKMHHVKHISFQLCKAVKCENIPDSIAVANRVE